MSVNANKSKLHTEVVQVVDLFNLMCAEGSEHTEWTQ